MAPTCIYTCRYEHILMMSTSGEECGKIAAKVGVLGAGRPWRLLELHIKSAGQEMGRRGLAYIALHGELRPSERPSPLVCLCSQVPHIGCVWDRFQLPMVRAAKALVLICPPVRLITMGSGPPSCARTRASEPSFCPLTCFTCPTMAPACSCLTLYSTPRSKLTGGTPHRIHIQDGPPVALKV